ncbi:hypothetical protein MBLNU230_g5227t1 [Neophaeotheca triangularis]
MSKNVVQSNEAQVSTRGTRVARKVYLDTEMVQPSSIKSSDATPSWTRVFNTTELCEAIFEQADVEEVVRMTRVCKNFRNVILGSISLRTKIFLEPESSITAGKTWTIEVQRNRRWDMASYTIHNQTIAESLKRTLKKDGTSETQQLDFYEVCPAICNPALCHPACSLLADRIPLRSQWLSPGFGWLRVLKAAWWPLLHERIADATGSRDNYICLPRDVLKLPQGDVMHRSMFLTQPPETSVALYPWFFSKPSVFYEVTNDAGVKLEDIISAQPTKPGTITGEGRENCEDSPLVVKLSLRSKRSCFVLSMEEVRDIEQHDRLQFLDILPHV